MMNRGGQSDNSPAERTGETYPKLSIDDEIVKKEGDTNG